MPFKRLEDLEETVARLQLVEPAILRNVVAALTPPQRTAEGLISALESRNLLTPYQSGTLRNGDVSELRLGPYKLLYQNAEGSFARVFRATSTVDGKTYGIKLLRDRWLKDAQAVMLFRREGELCKRLKHKNIVPIYEVFSEGNNHYITMEFVEGGNLRDFMKIRGQFSAEDVAKYGIDLCEGLQYALRMRVTHRDLKLSNALLSTDGVAKLIDFGLAGQDPGSPLLNADVNRAVEYATLEKNTHAPKGDPRSDIFFLGTMLYEMLTGVPPYPTTADADRRKVFARYRDIKPVRSVMPLASSEMATIIERMIHINPHDRYQTLGEVIKDLKKFLGLRDSAAGLTRKVPVRAKDLQTLIFVETSPLRQTALRDYFNKHKYRVLLMSTPDRALSRLDMDPPDAIVLMGEALKDSDLSRVFVDAQKKCAARGTALVMILPPKLSEKWPHVPEEGRSRILRGKPTLRDVRTAIVELLTPASEAASDTPPDTNRTGNPSDGELRVANPST